MTTTEQVENNEFRLDQNRGIREENLHEKGETNEWFDGCEHLGKNFFKKIYMMVMMEQYVKF